MYHSLFKKRQKPKQTKAQIIYGNQGTELTHISISESMNPQVSFNLSDKACA